MSRVVGGCRRLSVTDPDSTSLEAEIPREATEGERRGSTRLWEREDAELETCFNGIRTLTDGEGEGGREEPGASWEVPWQSPGRPTTA